MEVAGLPHRQVRRCVVTVRTPRVPTRGAGSLAMMLVALMVALGGCATAGGGVPGSVSRAVDQSTSAVATSRLALVLNSGARLTRAAASTTLSDMLGELESARASVLELPATVQDERMLRHQAVTAIDDAVAGAVKAQEAVASDDGSPSIDEGKAALDTAADRLADLKQRLAGAQ
jgi:hypothetical protein